MSLVLGLDPSLTSYGWCVYDSSKTGTDKVVERGRWNTSADTFEPMRYVAHRDSLREMIRKYNIKQVGVETPPVGPTGAWSQEKLYVLFMMNLEVMFTEEIDVVLLAPSQLTLYAKRWGAGIVKGDWFKSDMQAVARADILDLLHQPRHGDYKHKSPTKQDRLRTAGLAKYPVPIVDPMSYPKEVRKHLRIVGDEADAYHAAHCGHRFWMFHRGELTEDDLTPSEWDVFVKTHTYTRGVKKGLTEKDGIIFKEGKRFFRFATGS